MDPFEWSNFWTDYWGAGSNEFQEDLNEWRTFGEDDVSQDPSRCGQDEGCAGYEVPLKDAEEWATLEPEEMAWSTMNRTYEYTYENGKLKKVMAMVLIRRLKGKNGRYGSVWAGCGNDRKVILIDTADKSRFKPRRSKKCRSFVDFKELSYLEKMRVESAAADLAIRHEKDSKTRKTNPVGDDKKKTSGKNEKKGQKKGADATATSTSVLSWGVHAMSVCWTYKNFGAIPAAAWIIWKVVGGWQVLETVDETVETGNEIAMRLEAQGEEFQKLLDRIRNWQWDLIVPCMFLAFILLHCLYKLWRGPASCDRDEDDVSSQGTATDEESEGEKEKESASAKATRLELAAMKEEMRAMMQKQQVGQLQASHAQLQKAKDDKLQEQGVQISDLVKRIKLQQEMVRRDTERMRREEQEATKPNVVDDAADAHLAELRSANTDYKDFADKQLVMSNGSRGKAYKCLAGSNQPTGPPMIAKVFKNGYNFTSYFEKWLFDKKLLKSSIVNEVRLLSAGADADVEDVSSPCVERESFEMKTSKLHGFMMAFDDVKEESDWRPPKGQNSRSWKSKVKWALLDMHDPTKMAVPSSAIENVDRARAEVSQNKTNFQKHLDSLTASVVDEHILVHVDDKSGS